VRVAILGCGISGLFAAKACEDAGVKDISIWSKYADMPRVFGFQYLHDNCGMPIQSQILREDILQSNIPIDVCEKLYSIKVYGNDSTKNSISKLLSHNKQIYNLADAVDILWNKYGSIVQHVDINSMSDLAFFQAYDKVFSSIPATQFVGILEITTNLHYRTAYVYTCPTASIANTVFFDVDPSNPVYRYGTLFNNFFMEANKPIIPNMAAVRKVEGADLAMQFPDYVIPIGRYGEWNKEVLAHNVYYKVLEECKNDLYSKPSLPKRS
jgi:hypothetical protein